LVALRSDRDAETVHDGKRLEFGISVVLATEALNEIRAASIRA
jgi:hypothetical protein